MPFKLWCQLIDMLPLQGGFIKTGVRGDMLSDQIERRTLKDTKRLGLNVLKGCLRRNMVIGKQFQHLPGFGEVLVSLDTIVIDRVEANKGTKGFTAFQLIYFTMSYEEGSLRKCRWT